MKSWIRFCFTIFILSIQISVFADAELWQIIEHNNSSNLAKKPITTVYQQALLLKLNQQDMRLRLQVGVTNSKHAKSSTSSNAIEIPMLLPDGNSTKLNLVPDNILSSRLADKFPQITTYRVLPNKLIFGGKVDMTPNGFHAMLQTFDGEVIFIDPIDVVKGIYTSYKKSEQRQGRYRDYSCGVSSQDDVLDVDLAHKPQRVVLKTQESLLNYRIAIAATGEYTAKHGGTVEGALSAMVTSLNRVNQVLERDLGIHLNLVENNDLLINVDAQSDPFTETDLIKLVVQNQQYLDAVIGSKNYDIGHLFSASGGGLAAIASVCDVSDKAKGISGIRSPQSDSFDLDFVAHEIGHQLGATHTFNSSQGLCAGNTRTARTAFEPGSGSSIMSYAGYCGLDNLQSNTDAMYHIGSIQQINAFTQGASCGSRKASQNQLPKPNAGKDYYIPSRTPFELTGSAIDSDGDRLVVAWEQLDAGDSSAAYNDKGNNALFRVHTPSDKMQRSFPPLENILNHSSSKGETLPEYQRSLRFSFIAQDGYNVAQSDEMIIQVERTGSRFALNLPRSQYTLGETYQVFWNVANTSLAPINCQNVDVLLSIDGGSRFDQVLAKNVSNNGETWVTIPVDSPTSTRARFKLKCSDNIFFALSYRDFVLTEKRTPVTFQYSDEDQPESGLKDTNIDVISNGNNVSNNTSGGIQNQAGGALELWFYLFLFVSLFVKVADGIIHSKELS